MASRDPILTKIVIQRNQSLSWRGLGYALAVGSLPSLAYAGYAVFTASWPIVGFCFGALLLLAAALYVVMLAAEEREVLTFTERSVIVESGRYGPRMRVKLDRYWARVGFTESPSAALTLTSRSVSVEIAAALSSPERERLARRVAALVGPRAAALDTARARAPQAADTGSSGR